MNLEHLYTAVELVRSGCYRDNPREATRLRTYPVMIAAAAAPAASPTEAFLRAACLAYAWMPERVRIDQSHLAPAVSAFEAARASSRSGPQSASDAELAALRERGIDAVAASLSSVVGASLVLHLAAPGLFPIWDERIERFRLDEEPSPYHMGQARHYLDFIDEIRDLTAHPLFLTFHNDFCTAYQARLQRLRISPYPLTEPKVVEEAITELAGD
ncbi:hypothetical protein [Thiocapsa marina]|uniref:Uncharacterized protein n=1 Tax=Thiocapsa marina 5811 TaxID=768671 RepID=F9UDJ3_9GAMM|nr:hypothetical protein [Thiocapsa marina]EGV17937.1 hypothetical protein ThimaDRAFT_2996 [Thiocapsa marina 5811]